MRTIEGVERFAVSDDGQRVVVIELVVKLVRVGVWLSGLLRRTGALLRCVMLLTGVICVTALRTDGRECCVGMIQILISLLKHTPSNAALN